MVFQHIHACHNASVIDNAPAIVRYSMPCGMPHGIVQQPTVFRAGNLCDDIVPSPNGNQDDAACNQMASCSQQPFCVVL